MRSSVALTLRDGTVLRETTGYPKRHVENPMSEADVEEKFRTLAGRIASPSWTGRALGVAGRIDELPDTSVLVDVFATEFARESGTKEDR
jgi:2-methylcitrate dehydratase PrpD